MFRMIELMRFSRINLWYLFYIRRTMLWALI